MSFLQREHRAMVADYLRNADAARAEYQELGTLAAGGQGSLGG